MKINTQLPDQHDESQQCRLAQEQLVLPLKILLVLGDYSPMASNHLS